jgi:hypothetical protein
MPRPWSEQRKKHLSSMQAAGRRGDEIAAALGLRREQVVARLKLIASWDRNRATFAKALQKRAQARLARGRKAIAGMKRAIATGVPRNRAIAQAYAAGATWREIGAHFWHYRGGCERRDAETSPGLAARKGAGSEGLCARAGAEALRGRLRRAPHPN